MPATPALTRILERPGLVAGLLAAASAALLSGAFAFQYIGGLAPCVLCIWQRWPYAVVIGLGVIGAGLARGAAPPKGALAAVLGLAALALFVDAGIAGFHVGVEQKWWEGTQACVGTGPSGAKTAQQMVAELLNTKVVRCDEVAWSLAGISMAGYNMIAALGLGVFATLGALRTAGRGGKTEVIHG
ncbi:MAG: disulfide bond formation protein B [Alphaproteobacteria bacterium]|nr:disulfide bond formation protein B [Alphaproteobacteria bacterium]